VDPKLGYNKARGLLVIKRDNHKKIGIEEHSILKV
jgi:hypothetical protein